MAVANSIQSELDEAEHVIRQQMARIAELEIEVERLRATASAHSVLREIYLNPASPEGNRIKAATAALQHETPKLMSVPPPLELTAEPVVPLAELVEARRARQSRLCPASAEPPIELVPIADGRRHGNGNGNDAGSSGQDD